MNVFDTFIFGHDLDMLQMRLEELVLTATKHILVEAAQDHQGNPKPLYYAENKERFAPWNDKIVHVVADLPTAAESLDPWVRERTQREFVRQGLYQAGAQDEDIVLLCDVDEIPSTSAIFQLTMDTLPCLQTLCMDMAMFAVDWVLPEQMEIAIAGHFGDMKSFPFGVLRENGYRMANPQIEDAGWHFSWLGGPEEIERKANYFCHLELRDLILQGNAEHQWYERGVTWYGSNWTHRGRPPEHNLHYMIPAVVGDDDKQWPAYIRERRCPDIWFRPGIVHR